MMCLKAKFCPYEPPLVFIIPPGAQAAELERRLLSPISPEIFGRGRKRPGWKREFLKTLSDASADLDGVSEKQISIRSERSGRRGTGRS